MKRRITLALAALLCTFGVIQAQIDFTADGDYYLITSAEDIVKLSNYSNNGATMADVQNAKFKVTQDIDMSGVENFTPIHYTSSNGESFKGIFDGQGHTISNVTITTSDNNANHLGFFGLVNTGTVRNLCIKDITINNNSTYPVARGGLVGRNGSGVIENCCVVNFTFNDQRITEISTSSIGGVIGYLSSAVETIVKNCYSYNAKRIVEGEPILLNVYGKKGAKATEVKNNYDDAKSDADDFNSGRICFLLNGSQSDNPVWYQTLGTDESPVLDKTHGTVYLANDLTCNGQTKGEYIYGNNGVGKRDEHTFVNGICTVCGSADPTWVEAIDGVYQIGTPAQLQWFAALVNEVDDHANACLINDIDLGSIDNFTPIGLYGDNSPKKGNYYGTFDGQGHIVSNLSVYSEDNYEAGLFSRTYKATVKNLGVVNATVSSNNQDGRIGVLAGFNRESTFINCCSNVFWVLISIEDNQQPKPGCE